jgi:hypothetical protein
MKQQRAPYAIVSDETWELVRAAYLSGLSASVVAARFGITVWGLRKRAGREGWTKLAYAAAREENARPSGEDSRSGLSPPPDEPEPDAESVVRAAMARAGRALMTGQGAEAQALVRATEGYLRLQAAIYRDGIGDPQFADTPGRRAALAGLREVYGLPEDADDL